MSSSPPFGVPKSINTINDPTIWNKDTRMPKELRQVFACNPAVSKWIPIGKMFDPMSDDESDDDDTEEYKDETRTNNHVYMEETGFYNRYGVRKSIRRNYFSTDKSHHKVECTRQQAEAAAIANPTTCHDDDDPTPGFYDGPDFDGFE